jgi:glutaryl-CoA dehydrogenase
MTEDLQVGIGDALSTDYLLLREQLTDTQLDYLARARRFVDEEVLSTINDYWDRAEFPWPLVEKLGTTGLVGDGIAGYGCPALGPLSAGLITMELNRGDGSIGTFLGVQAGLAMRSIAHCGSEEQKQRWLPPMARLERIGAFALTEPDHGSDAVSLQTTARRDGDSCVLDGHKKWIGNGTIADVVVVWARDTADGRVKGFLVEKETPGYRARLIERKASLLAVWQPEIALDGVRVEEHDRLPGRTPSPKPPRCSPPPAAPAPGWRSATRSPGSTPPSATPADVASSGIPWPISRSCNSAWCACSPT